MNLRSILGRAAFFLLLAPAASIFAVTITNVEPPMGAVSEQVNIGGNGFAPGNHLPNTLSVKFNGVLATSNTNNVVRDDLIVCNVPAGATKGLVTVQINGGAAQNSPTNFIVISTNAYVTNIAPIFGNNDTTVVLTGVHFITATNVLFNGKISKTVPGLTPFIQLNSITVTAPDGVTTGPLTVMSSLGPSHNFSTESNQVSSATNFFVPPIITSFSPTAGRPNTNVVIHGTNFTGAASVSFGGVSALSFIVSNNNTMLATVPTNASTGVIQVNSPYTVPGASAAKFLIQPSIFSFSPTFGPSNTVVVIGGSGLNEKSPNPTVTIGAGTVTSFNTVSANTLSVNVPATATSGFITVTTTNGSITSTQLFYLPPTISSFTPGTGSFGTSVQINGSNFTNASAVTFGNLAAFSFQVTNNTTISAVAPSSVTSATISVTTPAGTATSASLFYAPPTVTNFIPTHGLPGTNVMIMGSNFTNASAVLFNGLAASSFKVTNNTILSAVVTNGTTTGKITVIAPGGTNSSAADFTIDSADLGVTVKDSPDPVFVGSNLVYTIIVTNSGLVSASNVRLTNSLPVSVTLKSATTSQGSLATNSSPPNPILGTLGTINSGSSATITVTVTPNVLGSITNTAVGGGDLPDSNLANNTNFVTTTVWPLPVLSITNLMSNDLVKISWPAPLSNFTLQFRTALSTNVQWTNDPGARTVSGTNISVTETNIGTARFFRLTN